MALTKRTVAPKRNPVKATAPRRATDAKVAEVRARLSKAGGVRTGAAMEVGIREFRAKFSEEMRRIREGATMTITDRGAPIAVILPAGVPYGIARMVADGRASWSGKRFVPGPMFRYPPGGKSLSDMAIEDRRDRERRLDAASRSGIPV